MIASDPSTASKTVLLVDDKSSSASIYCNRLEQAGFRITSASDARTAGEALPNIAADLIIVDLMLPRLGGLDLLQTIRANERHRSTPVLVLSNAYLPDLSQKAVRAGGNQTLSRSECTANQLVSTTRTLLGEAGGAPDSTSTEEAKQSLLASGAC